MMRMKRAITLVLSFVLVACAGGGAGPGQDKPAANPTTTGTSTASGAGDSATTNVAPDKSLAMPATASTPSTTASVAAPPPTSTTISSRVSSAPGTINSDGFLSLVCDPSCDEVILDGTRKLGKSPYGTVGVSPGKHELTFKLAGAPDKTATIPIKSGQTIAYRARMGVIVVPAGEPRPSPSK